MCKNGNVIASSCIYHNWEIYHTYIEEWNEASWHQGEEYEVDLVL